MFEIVIKAVISVVSALSGALLLFTIKLDHHKLCGLISFSAGALFSAALFTLLPEASHATGIIELAISVFSGYMLFYLMTKYYSHVCPACSATHFDEKTTQKFSEIVLTLLTALSIHSFLDGMAIASSLSAHADHSVFAAITTHKFPEGLALAALMLSSNYSKQRIIWSVVLVESTTIIGSLAGYYLFNSSISEEIMGILLAHIAGGFVFLALHAVIGEMFKNHKKLVIITFLSGVIIILAVHSLF